MAGQSVALDTTLEAIREQAKRLEQEAAALRAGLDEIAILLAWTLEHSVSPSALQKVPVTDAELAQYRVMLTEDYPDDLLRLTIKAQKVASQFKRALPLKERQAAIDALIAAFNAVAEAEHLAIPDELEAAIGD
ncbi:MAG: hypothetical protein ACE5NP_07415 [Anaerolineae bacterium]